jgi:hypothetical protein
MRAAAKRSRRRSWGAAWGRDAEFTERSRGGSQRSAAACCRRVGGVLSGGCHERGRAWLGEKLATKCDGPTVVISHHAPSLVGTDARFRKDYMTAAFVSDLEGLIETYSPTLWIHGHTHHCAQYLVGRTPVAANQKGYPHEPGAGQFDARLVVDI